MREWKLDKNNPIYMTLAVDARLSIPDYCNDQIWEFHLSGGDPAAITLQTTYGLRARSMRIFPRFIEGDTTRSDPEEFASQPVIQCFYPNFLEVMYAPFQDIDVIAEYWVPGSQTISGRIHIKNLSSITRQISLELVALLTPAEGGQRMVPIEIQATPVLCGQTADLSPVVFMTGGPIIAPGPFPALKIGLDLDPGASRQFIWTQAAFSTQEESFQRARQLASRIWDAERAQIEMLNAGQVEIHTGDPSWDLAFALSQKYAFSFFMGPTEYLPYKSFVSARSMDQGNSIRGDGSDYGPMWNGQSPLDTYLLSNLILPGYPHLIKGLLYNYISTQDDNGFIDWKPGLGGQTSNRLATPILATISWLTYQVSQDIPFLEKVFPGILRFFRTWFTPERDRDDDGLPEWDHPIQAGFEDHPIFSRWHSWAQGVDITTAESPAMCAFLYQECHSLINMARTLGLDEHIPYLRSISEHLIKTLETCWDEQAKTYHYRDRDTHLCSNKIDLAESFGSGKVILQKQFANPIRVQFHIVSPGESTRHPLVFLHGTSPSGNHRIERISSDNFQWYLGIGNATSERTYIELEYVEIQGLESNDHLWIRSPNFACDDQTLLSPIWAHLPDQKRASDLIENVITNPMRYWRPFGIPACPLPLPSTHAYSCQNIHLIWNILIGEGLVAYGYRNQAAELVNHLMNAITQNLTSNGTFARYYHAETGEGVGDRNSIYGLAPLGLFLKVLGVRLISPLKVALAGYNPFPWPVTVKYQGLTILRNQNNTQIIFPDGQMVTVEGTDPQIVSLE
jgi:hypothetical protein